TNETDIVEKHCRTTGLGGLALFAPREQQSSQHATAVADVISILQCCHTADDESRLLAMVCSRLRERLRAAGVAFFVEDGNAFVPIAADGSRVESGLGRRVVTIDQPIAPHYLNGRLEAGASIRYGGRRFGVLLARWPLGSACDPKDATMLLAAAATATGP